MSEVPLYAAVEDSEWGVTLRIQSTAENPFGVSPPPKQLGWQAEQRLAFHEAHGSA
jgi:hypothetical protein